jgi:primase-polymerase (primpol)-like protein
MTAMTLPPTAEDLPTALVDRDQWVCWRTHDRDDKPTKVPIIPETTQFASTTDPETWRSFATAREGVTTTPVDGLGFVFTADDPLIGIDLDDCRDPESGAPTAWADNIIADLDSYTEISPSGTGYHILVTGTLPDGRNRAGDLELYDRSRFFTVTGDHVDGTPATVCERNDAVATLHAAEIAASTATASTGDAEPGDAEPASAPEPASDEAAASDETQREAADISDTELLNRARNAANGDKFSRLWNGQTSGYESHSEADLALCRLLAFWTGRDAQRIDRLFRDSGLYREKWDTVHYADGSTYGAKTIERAIASTDDVYTPPATTDTATTTGATGTGSGTGVERAVGDRSDAQSASATASDAAAPADADVAATPAGRDSAAAPSAAQDLSVASEADDAPRSRTQREAARLARIEELTTRVEELLAENERLRADLEAERDRREELEAAVDEAEQTDAAGPTRSWWPFSR